MGRVFLAFDTAAAHCAAVLVAADGTIRAARHEEMARGQAERLLPLLAEVLAAGGCGWRDLAGLAVGIGPGNFTGVRIAVAAARGLAMGLGVPVAGISGFALLGDDAPAAPAEWRLLPTPRDRAYLQPWQDGAPAGAPRLIDPAAPPADLAGPGLVVRGHLAGPIAAAIGGTGVAVALTPADLPARLARQTVAVLGRGAAIPLPAPLYVRPPDADPPADLPPVILDA